MKETKWIGESGGKVSDSNNWDNGVPDNQMKAIFNVSERTEITWNLKSIGIPVEILCDPEDVVIYISGDCLVGGSYFVPDVIREHFESFREDDLNLDMLDRPPSGYVIFRTDYIWTGGGVAGDSAVVDVASGRDGAVGRSVRVEASATRGLVREVFGGGGRLDARELQTVEETLGPTAHVQERNPDRPG